MSEDYLHEELLTPEIVEAMGISQPAFEEVQCIVGRMPTVQELSTLLAMWEANGKQQSLYGWLKGQHHIVERHEYLYAGTDPAHKDIREPRVKDCIALAHELAKEQDICPDATQGKGFSRGENLYMVGNVSTEFLDSEYARKCLHIVSEPIKMSSTDEEIEYIGLILNSLLSADTITTLRPIGRGGLFMTLVACCRQRPTGEKHPTVGFDILTCREIRLDAFLFGEEPGRFVVSLPESQDDFFLLKLGEARVNCCFLGHATKGRVLVDDMDYGDVKEYIENEN